VPKSKKAGIDVANPGDSPAEATSRPVIINKGPALRDPMVTKEESTVTPSTPPPSVSKKKIEPIQHTEPTKSEPVVEDTDTSIVVNEADVLEQESKNDPGNHPEDKLAEEDKKRQELADKLIAERKYFVPIGAVHQRQTNMRVTAFLLICLVLLVAAVGAIDAEIVETNITLPFDLIK
jgi:hypothetical protein